MKLDGVIIGLLLILCMFSIYTDLKDGMIYNRHLLWIGLAAVVLHWGSFGIYDGNWWKENALLVAAGIGVSLFLYYRKIWAGGDCKL